MYLDIHKEKRLMRAEIELWTSESWNESNRDQTSGSEFDRRNGPIFSSANSDRPIQMIDV
uniref:Uncharacterized protein n=1 Tax=Onchocerca volvulus TaxID=6282 RepID=A0A8R1Y4P1_ONCVO